MKKITQKQLIASLEQLKEIQPRKEWALLLKSQILSPKQAEAEVSFTNQKAQSAGFFNTISSAFFQRKLAYSFAALLFMVVGVLSFSKYEMPGKTSSQVKEIADQSQASLIGQTGLNQDVATLNNKINDLAQATKEGKTKNIPSAINEVSANVSQLAQNLKANPTQDSTTIKNIAASLKTLADVPGTDLNTNQDVKDLYQTVVLSQIADMQKTTLTDAQKSILTQAETLSDQGKYAEALEVLMTSN